MSLRVAEEVERYRAFVEHLRAIWSTKLRDASFTRRSEDRTVLLMLSKLYKLESSVTELNAVLRPSSAHTVLLAC